MLRELAQRTLGRLLNLVGVPGFIRARGCHDRLGIPIEIRIDDRFTVIMIDRTRLLFHRVTGRFDGVVIDEEDCSRGRSAG